MKHKNNGIIFAQVENGMKEWTDFNKTLPECSSNFIILPGKRAWDYRIY